MDKTEREERFTEFVERGCPREFAQVIVDAEEAIERRDRRIVNTKALLADLKEKGAVNGAVFTALVRALKA